MSLTTAEAREKCPVKLGVIDCCYQCKLMGDDCDPEKEYGGIQKDCKNCSQKKMCALVPFTEEEEKIYKENMDWQRECKLDREISAGIKSGGKDDYLRIGSDGRRR
jgi:hypothetical protein